MIYRVGSAAIDPANFLLTRDGESVPVEPLVFDLIVYLLENRDRVLTRQELLDNVWANRVVSDTTLSNHIKSARQALGDDGQRQVVIKTIHGRGYRFVGNVEEVTDGDAVGRPAYGRSRLPVSGVSQILVIVLVIAALFAIVAGGRNLIFPPDEVIQSLVVLPLKDLSDDPAQKYFVEGMQDALITRLSQTTELRVISKTSAMRYENTSKSIPEIARELNVDAVIEGSVLRDGERVRITAQLICGSEDEHLWARNYDRDLGDVLTLINEISMAIADEVRATVNHRAVERVAERRTVEPKVHELVLQGQHYFDRYMFDKSLDCFQEAVELDPSFAPAHVGVAGTYLVKQLFEWTPDAAFVPEARAAALTAISLDSNSAGGHAGLGVIQLYFDWDWESAAKNLSRALELMPNDARTRHAYADYLMVMGDLEGSLEQVEIGLLYDPLSPMANNVVSFHRILARHYDDVIAEAQKLLSTRPELLPNLTDYHEALWLTGRFEEAFAAYKASWGKDEVLLLAMEQGFSESGYLGAVYSLAEALTKRDPEHEGFITIAKLYALAGAPDKALDWLETAYTYRHPQLVHVKAMPVFDELRDDPGYQDLLQRIGFP
ncbi:MAG: winged helix-turn-helix domain-containing protein [Woeseiaceae bacterium]|nr:winged helix-turn-helix domain-containing protein [Woeseiaceae bacterium]